MKNRARAHACACPLLGARACASARAHRPPRVRARVRVRAGMCVQVQTRKEHRTEPSTFSCVDTGSFTTHRITKRTTDSTQREAVLGILTGAPRVEDASYRRPPQITPRESQSGTKLISAQAQHVTSRCYFVRVWRLAKDNLLMWQRLRHRTRFTKHMPDKRVLSVQTTRPRLSLHTHVTLQTFGDTTDTTAADDKINFTDTKALPKAYNECDAVR